MSTIFEGTPKFHGIRGDIARMTFIDGRVLIRAVDTTAATIATIAMTPDQARAFAAGIMAAADSAEGGAA